MWRWRSEQGYSQDKYPSAEAALDGVFEEVMYVLHTAELGGKRWELREALELQQYRLQWYEGSLLRHLDFFVEEYDE